MNRAELSKLLAVATAKYFMATDPDRVLLQRDLEVIIDNYCQAREQQALLDKFAEYNIVVQQQIWGALLYKYFLLDTNAANAEVKLSGFSYKDKLLGDLTIKVELTAPTQPQPTERDIGG